MQNYNQVNFLQNTSSNNNYDTFKTSSRFDSFPKMVGNGVLVEYKRANLLSEIIKNDDLGTKESKSNEPKLSK